MGVRCARCGATEDLIWGNTLCRRCAYPKHKIYMHYFCRGSENGSVWVLNFLYPDARTSVCRPKQFSSEDVIWRLAERGNALKCLADRQALESGIEHGRGGMDLYLSEQQMAKLKR